MDNFANEEESQFFDALEHIALESDLVSHCLQSFRNWEYDVWTGTPHSVDERRKSFFRRTGLSLGEVGREVVGTCGDSKGDSFMGDIQRVKEDSGTVLRSSGIEDEFSSSRSSVSSWDTNDLEGVDLCECRHGDLNLNGECECDVDAMFENERRVMGREGMLSSGELDIDSAYELSPSQRIVDRENEVNVVNTPKTQSKLKRRWLQRLLSMTCMMGGGVKEENVGSYGLTRTTIRRVRVRHSQRRLKELSALFTGQEIQAHEGCILAMKFSHDGQYLATAGEDKIVRVWQVVEDERLDTVDIPDADPSSVYFSVNHLSDLGPFKVEKESNKSKSLISTHDSACIVFPRKVFRILEKPLHVFEGHSGEILDLSWSKDNCLLSSSVDNTVRLWRVGVDNCLKVFHHSDYVTCIQFNPMDDNHFISGSIDGKVRIWSVGGCNVVDWIETRDIVTAVSYRPDGQAGIIGSIAGTCRLFHSSDNHLHLGDQICLASKKKSPCRRITGFQFSPQDPHKILVSSADSKVRVIDGVNVIGKYKGPRNCGSQSSARFTSDGKHVVSTSEDSNVYIWNYSDQPKSVRPFECFSSDASIAVPWPGNSDHLHTNSLPFSSSTSLSLGLDYFFDSSSKSSATWPEEKLPISKSPMSKSQCKLLKSSCENASSSHAWGLVIVTAGWDGRIRSFHNYGLPVSL